MCLPLVVDKGCRGGGGEFGGSNDVRSLIVRVFIVAQFV